MNSQRAGPSTGLPTKTEQSDLYLAVYGRNADAPLVVLAARSSADAFDVAIEAVRLATRYMTPVVVLSDTFIANAAEPWRLPDVGAFESFPVEFRTEVDGFPAPMGETRRRWLGPGSGPARPASSIESAAWRRTTPRATSPTTPKTISA